MSGNVLVIGYGNPGRLDDGLGPAIIEALEKTPMAGVALDADYQLTVEHAAEVSKSRVVFFVDASVTGGAPYELQKLEPQAAETLDFSSHSLSAQGVLTLSRELFGRAPEAWLLSIRGYEFNAFKEELSDAARANMHAALAHLKPLLAGHSATEITCNTEDSEESYAKQ